MYHTRAASVSLLILVVQIDAAGARGRSNDMGRLRDRILSYAGIEMTKEVNSLKSRGSRGWNNATLARLLCPMNKLREFDADPDA